MSGDSSNGQSSLFPQDDGGSNPTSPLYPRQLTLKVISRQEARKIWINNHYLHRDFAGAAVEFGVFSPTNELVGALGFSEAMGGSRKGGHPDTFELRRFWLNDCCAKNSESRVLSVCVRWVSKYCPHVKYIVSYSDHTKMKHAGTIYKASGFKKRGETGSSASWSTHSNHKAPDNWSKTRWVYNLRWRKKSEHISVLNRAKNNS